MSITSVQRRYFTHLTINSASYAACSESIFAACAENVFALFDSVTLKRTIDFKSEAHAATCIGLDSASRVNGMHMSLKPDGTVCLWNMRQKEHLVAESPAGRQFLPPNATFTCCAIRPDGLYVCTGTDVMRNDAGPSKSKKMNRKKNAEEEETDAEDPPNVYLLGWDVRQLKEPVIQLGEVHSDCINSIRFPRNNSHQVLSCSDDGLVCISNLSAPIDDCLVEVFNAERPANHCDWLYRRRNPSTPIGAFSINNMAKEITAWSNDMELPQWSSVKTPKYSKNLLTAGFLNSIGAKREPKLCLLSTDFVRQDIRFSIVSKQKSSVVARHSLRAKNLGVESEMLYAAFLDENGCPTANPKGFHVLVAGSHSLHRLELKLA